MEQAALYRTIWRWHFYAGLFVIPFIIILSVTGSIYLFKPQIDRWQEREWRGLSIEGSVSAEDQVAAAMAVMPKGQVHNYRLPERAGDAAMVHIGLPDGSGMRDVYVSPKGEVMAKIDPESRISATIARIHSSLLVGKFGGYLVELAASWAIVMILTGLYLWWPRNGTAGKGRLAGVLWPRLKFGGRMFWKDLHAVTGFWISGLVLITLASGLPWTDGWATAFRYVRGEMGWVTQAPQDWKGGVDLHAAHDHGAMMAEQVPVMPEANMGLNDIVARAEKENMPFPAIILPPGAPARFGPPNGADWKLTSEAQNRPLIRTVTYDAQTGEETGRNGFADRHVIDRVINYGIAWHEGQLLGLFNQIVGVVTALALILLSVSSVKMWWQRRPQNAGLFTIGAPPAPPKKAVLRGVAVIIVLLALFLPMLALSLLILLAIDMLVKLRRRLAVI